MEFCINIHGCQSYPRNGFLCSKSAQQLYLLLATVCITIFHKESLSKSKWVYSVKTSMLKFSVKMVDCARSTSQDKHSILLHCSPANSELALIYCHWKTRLFASFHS